MNFYLSLHKNLTPDQTNNQSYAFEINFTTVNTLICSPLENSCHVIEIEKRSFEGKKKRKKKSSYQVRLRC